MYQSIKYYFFGIFQSDPREISSLNGIRCLGFFLLILGHFYRPFEPSIQNPNFLVKNLFNSTSLCMDIFFVLSGFLISGPLFKELEKKNTIHWGKFITKRTLRIFPPYFIFLLIQTFLIFPLWIQLQPDFAESIQELRSKVIYDFFYLSNYVMGTVPHGWSLSLEEQFYLLFPPFLLFVFRKIPKRYRIYSLIFFIVAPLIYRCAIYYILIAPAEPVLAVKLYHQYIYYPLQGRLDNLFAGILLAYIYHTYPEKLKNLLQRKENVWVASSTATALVFVFSLFVYEFDKNPIGMVFRFSVNSFCWATLLLVSMKPGTFANRLFSWKGFSPVAKLTYCTYLIHFLFLGILTPVFINMKEPKYSDFFIYTIPMGISLLFIGYIFHLLTERPFMLLKEKFFGKVVEMQATIKT